MKAGEQVEEGEGRMKAREGRCTLEKEAEGISGKEGDRRQNKGVQTGEGRRREKREGRRRRIGDTKRGMQTGDAGC